MKNNVVLKFYSKSENEQLARSCVSALLLPYNPTVSELTDIKTAVSEAVTNAIVHGYPDTLGLVTLEMELSNDRIHIMVKDEGVGIENTEIVQEPFYTTKASQERTGIGFTIMKSFMDDIKVESKVGSGTVIYMVKNIANA